MSTSEKHMGTGELLSFLRKKWYLPLLLLIGAVLLIVGSVSGTETKTSENTTDTQAYRHAMEEEVTRLCRQVKGVGDVSVMVILESGETAEYGGSHLLTTHTPAVRGVAVVCEGGGDTRVRQEVTDLLCALFHIGAHRVYIAEMK